MHREPFTDRPQQNFAFHAANLKKYFSFIWGWRQQQESGWRRLTKPLFESLLWRAGGFRQVNFGNHTFSAREGSRGQHRLTLPPPVLAPQFQPQSRIYRQSGPGALSCRCGTLYPGLCCKAPIGESHGLPCPPEDSSLSSCFSPLLTEFLRRATEAPSFLTG